MGRGAALFAGKAGLGDLALGGLLGGSLGNLGFGGLAGTLDVYGLDVDKFLVGLFVEMGCWNEKGLFIHEEIYLTRFYNCIS